MHVCVVGDVCGTVCGTVCACEWCDVVVVCGCGYHVLLFTHQSEDQILQLLKMLEFEAKLSK